MRRLLSELASVALGMAVLAILLLAHIITR